MPAKKKETKPKKGKTTTKKTPAKAKSTAKRTISRKSPAEKQKESFYIVGMGASAGGLEAFEKFFSSAPPEANMAFVLVPHLDPSHVSIMPQLLQKYTKMEVLQAEDGMEVEPNRVYVIRPNKDMAILNGTLQLMEPRTAGGLRMPIDYFLRSLAQDQKERAICVILSGMGTDGTLGLKAIKGELGMALVQDPDSCKYDGMPRSAIATGLADFVSPPEKMPQQLVDYTKSAARLEVVGRPLAEGKVSDHLAKVFVLLRDHTGHDFSLYKKNTIFRRLERRMNVHQLENLSLYVRYLEQNPHELSLLFKELLIGVTNFFRDPEGFEVLKNKALPEIFENKRKGESIRVWVPSCSSGEEAFSIGMIIRECMDKLNKAVGVQIFATDIDADAIQVARSGVYPDSISADVSKERLKRFFTAYDSAFQIKNDIREMCVFAVQDVIKDPPFTKLDLVCCRNLLIYMESELQKKLLPVFHYALKPNGILFLGSSETIGVFTDLFSTVDKKWKVYRRKESTAAIHRIVEFSAPTTGATRTPPPAKELPELTVVQLAQKVLLEDYAPPSVIVDEKGNMLYIHGRTGKYLEPAPGEIRSNILDMAREGLKLELPAAMRKAMSERKHVTFEGLRVKVNGGVQKVNLTVKPVGQAGAPPRLMMVVFEDVATPVDLEPAEAQRVTAKKKSDLKVEELEKALAITRENLQVTLEEMETSNEELKSTNEELQSTNEELQSTNEELETSKEELQSVNEELMTVNAELEGKIAQLSKSNDDMKNLLDSTEIPTIFLDNDLFIKRFTPHASKVINLIHTDIGRPVTHIVTNLKYENLIEDAQGVLDNLGFKEVEVQTKDDRWYLMRIMPYRTVENVIDGLSITFLDIHELKTAAEKIEKQSKLTQDAVAYAEDIIDTVREPLLVLDEKLRISSANRSFYETFQVSSKQTVGQLIYDLGNRQWDIPKLRQLLEDIVPKNASFEGFEVNHEFPGVGFKRMLLNARKVFRSPKEKELVLLAMEDVSPK